MVLWYVAPFILLLYVIWYDEYFAWSVLLIRPHVRGDELKIQAPDLPT